MQSLMKEVLENVKNSTSIFFEKMVIELLVKMGYGGSIKEAGKAIGNRWVLLKTYWVLMLFMFKQRTGKIKKYAARRFKNSLWHYMDKKDYFHNNWTIFE